MEDTYAKIILDSISPNGDRLTTMEVKMHRFVLAEINTHRKFCLAGDSVLEFDLPAGSGKYDRRPHRMTLAEFADKWHNGANRLAANPKRTHDLTWLDDEQWVSAPALAERIGFSKSAIHSACRKGSVLAKKGPDGRTWLVNGHSFKEWRSSSPDHTRFPIRNRLKNMKIRQLNEETGLIQNASVLDCFVSGEKEVFEVTLESGHKVAGSKDHRILTSEGWKPIRDIKVGMDVTISSWGRPESARFGDRFKKIDGHWRSVWQRKKRVEMVAAGKTCACGSSESLEIHHVVPVHKDPSLTFVDSNVKLVCATCHNKEHSSQEWDRGSVLYGGHSKVASIVSRGIEQTYDLTISGQFPNFLASGIVVHNSRNSSSSRAIPLSKQVERVFENPAYPVSFPAEQPGMQGGDELHGVDAQLAKSLVETIRLDILGTIAGYTDSLEQIYGDSYKEHSLHKSVLSRYLEPFMWQTVIISGTEWDNFFAQRVSLLAQPELMQAAKAMQDTLRSSTPQEVKWGKWHLPYIDDETYVTADKAGMSLEDVKKISVARCARVSYLTHDGKRDLSKDIDLYDKLMSANPKHYSPLEHVATPSYDPALEANFDGWIQLRALESQNER